MATWKPAFDPDHFYFVTTSAVDHVHLFEPDVIKRLLLDAMDCFRLRGLMKLYCFVIMPNHIHFIGQFSEQYPLANMVRDFKKETSDRLLRQLEAEGNMKELQMLAGKVDRPGKQKYKVWDSDYNAKEIFSADFLQQKMDYIHENPCREPWRLSGSAEEYIWSSARFYLTSERCIVPIDDVRAALLIDA